MEVELRMKNSLVDEIKKQTNVIFQNIQITLDSVL
jgi:hypothetical protein